jgi:hypothetical protein
VEFVEYNGIRGISKRKAELILRFEVGVVVGGISKREKKRPLDGTTILMLILMEHCVKVGLDSPVPGQRPVKVSYEPSGSIKCGNSCIAEWSATSQELCSMELDKYLFVTSLEDSNYSLSQFSLSIVLSSSNNKVSLLLRFEKLKVYLFLI